MLNNLNYNPDVLNCLANLSSDEVFTPPQLANSMLDTLPKSVWKNKNIKFLDPSTKSGVFLREITKRLISGLKDEIPDLNKRIDHILKNQVFGIATTELTSLISKRTLYCSKDANGEYSIIDNFEDNDGNIFYQPGEHTWRNKSCIYCGANQSTLDRGSEYESYAYQFIHDNNIRLKEMKFDVIIGNPPYQLNVGVEKKNHAILIFHKFVEMAIKLNPSYISMIIPSRWFTGGRGLDDFRDKMLNDKRIKEIVDYVDSRECFNGVDVTGGAMYFLWDKNYNGDCNFTNINKGKSSKSKRKLNKYHVFTRYNEADTIIDKVLNKNNNKKFLSDFVSVQTPFGLYTNFWDKDDEIDGTVGVYTSKGVTFTSLENIKSNREIINDYKVIVTAATSEHAGQSDKSGMRRVLSTIEILKPGVVCTQSYLVVKNFKNQKQAKNLVSYLKTKFLRFMLFQAITSQHISREKFCFVPDLNYDQDLSDEIIYKMFNLNKDEINLIETMIKEI